MNIHTPHYLLHRGVRTLLIFTLFMLTALPSFAENSYILQYTSNRNHSDSLITADADTPVEFTQGDTIYLKITEGNETSASGASTNAASENGEIPSLTVLQRNTKTQEETVLTPDDSSFYTMDTKTIGTYQILVDHQVLMNFTVKEKTQPAVQPIPVKPVSKAGVFQKGKYYFYKDAKGKVRKSKGFVRWNGNLYYVQKGGRIQAGKSFKLGKYTYRAAKNGRIKVGTYKWGKYYYYSSSKGRLRKSKGFVTWKGNRYYIRKGGHLRTGKSFKVSKHTYRAAKDGRIKVGVYKWGKSYYYSTSTGKLRKKAGFISWNGRHYYSRKNGTLYVNRFYFHGGNMYYAGSNAAARTGTFKVGKYEYTADAGGIITHSSRKYMRGIDVSYYQGKNINWSKVKSSGISFAFLRCGYSGTKNGSRNKDSTFQGNIKGATAAGVDVGAYYFSQAITTKEAVAEADYAVKQVQSSGCKLTLPLVIDTENIQGRASSSKLSKAKRTQVIKAFCDRVKAKGYTPMIYASTSWLNNNLDMKKLSGYKVWVAQYYDKVTYKGKYQCWQYTSSGKVSGISGRVDMNYWVL